MGTVIFSLILSCVFVGLICLVSGQRHGLLKAAGISLGAFAFAFFGCSIPLLLQSAATLALTLLVSPFANSGRAITVAAALAMAGVYVMLIPHGLRRMAEQGELRREFPLISVADRLAFEDGRLHAALEAAMTPQLASSVESRIENFEQAQGDNWHSRNQMLQELHDRTSEDFALAQGFGLSRMVGGVYREGLVLPDVPPVKLPQSAPEEFEYQPLPKLITEDVLPLASAPALPQNKLLKLHDMGLNDFFDADRLGYVQDREHVAGFEPHRFRRIPAIDPWDDGLQEWQLVRLELVSLLRHDPPAAYLSENLPDMAELAKFKTRPLSPFEEASLPKLRTEEDMVVQNEPDRIVMLGSVRAAKNCLECHNVRRGELLGAFSYELRPARQPVKTPPALEPERL